MGVLLAFASFIAFALLDRLVGSTQGLVVGALVAAALGIRDGMTPGRAPKIIEIATILLFGGLALYALLGHPTWSVVGVRLCVDAGLLLIVLVSLAIGRPFTLQYAREQVEPGLWGNAEFIRINYVLSAAWALAFLVMVLAECALLFIPGLPRRVAIIAIVLALVGAVKFTDWYPKRAASRPPA